MNFPAILRGWVERVFTYGFGYLTERRGLVTRRYRRPEAAHEAIGEALIMTLDVLPREGLPRVRHVACAIEQVIDEWGFRYPGIERRRTRLFYAVQAVDNEARRGYLQQAYRLGHEFESSIATATAPEREAVLAGSVATRKSEEER